MYIEKWDSERYGVYSFAKPIVIIKKDVIFIIGLRKSKENNPEEKTEVETEDTKPEKETIK